MIGALTRAGHSRLSRNDSVIHFEIRNTIVRVAIYRILTRPSKSTRFADINDHRSNTKILVLYIPQLIVVLGDCCKTTISSVKDIANHSHSFGRYKWWWWWKHEILQSVIIGFILQLRQITALYRTVKRFRRAQKVQNITKCVPSRSMKCAPASFFASA